METLQLRASDLLPFEPNLNWFLRDAIGIHGVAHQTRVLIWTQLLARELGIDARVLAWASSIHDTQRLDDGEDPEHGARAARWVRANLRQLAPEIDLDTVEYLCRWHVPADHWAPRMTPELAAFKDADALDRWRIADFDPAFLRNPASRMLVGPSEQLWKATRRVGLTNARGAFRDVLGAAADLGIIGR